MMTGKHVTYTASLIILLSLIAFIPSSEVHAGAEIVTNGGWYTSIALNGGNPVISYFSGNVLRVVACNDPACAGNDETMTIVDSAGTVGYNTSLTLNGSNPVISYYDYTNADLKVAACNDPACAGNDETITTVDSAGSVGQYTSIALNGSNPVISYYDSSVGNYDLKVVACNDPACTGNDETITTLDSTGAVGQGTSITMNGSNPVISYYDVTNSALKVVACNDPACTGNDETITTVDNTGDVGLQTSITMNGSNPVISYFDRTNLDLKVVACNDPACTGNDETITTVDSTGDVGTYPSITMNGSNPVISYLDITNSALKVVACNDPACAGNDETIRTLDSTGNNFLFSSIALNSGNPVISYYDAINFNLKVYTDVPLSATAACNDDNLNVTITAGDGPFNITGTGIGLPANGVSTGLTTLTGPNTWMGVTITETTGNTEALNLGDFTCEVIIPTTEPINPAPQIDVFDPAISKIGFLVPGQVGVTGEQLEWIVTVSNVGNAQGFNVVVTDTLIPELKVNSVDAPGGNVTISGQTVTVTYPIVNIGEIKQFSIFTTVLAGQEVINVACTNADNQAVEECATGSAVSSLPKTGERGQ